MSPKSTPCTETKSAELGPNPAGETIDTADGAGAKGKDNVSAWGYTIKLQRNAWVGETAGNGEIGVQAEYEPDVPGEISLGRLQLQSSVRDRHAPMSMS